MRHNLFRLLAAIPVLVAWCSAPLGAQNLSLEEAIKTGLENNYAVKMYRNDKSIAALQNTAGNAGMLPTVSLNGSVGYANANSYQEFASGAVQDRKGAVSDNAAASLNVGWIVFDGMKMFAVKKMLDYAEQRSDLELKQQLETTVYEIVVAYYDVVRIQQLIKTAEQNLTLYAERKKIAQARFDVGSEGKVDVLLLQTDENRARTDLLRLQQQLLAAKVTLNGLLARGVDVDFSTTDSITTNYNPSYEQLKSTVYKTNTGLGIFAQSERITEQNIRQAKGNLLPQIQLNGAYNFTASESQAGFVALNRQNGFNGGITASWALFNGMRNKNLIAQRKIELLSQQQATAQYKQTVDALVYVDYKNFTMNKTILDMEKENLKASEQLLQISMERYRSGKANLLETKETQQNLEDAQARYINALFEAKKSETQLLRQNGELLK